MANNLTPMNLLTKVRVLRGVPFDSNYRNVCDGYGSADDQYTKITSGRVKYTYENISPIRHQNVLRLPVCADFLYDCNYLVWQNANFTNKWFYAFITKIDWININCCHVHYEIDVWNTGYYDGMTSDRTARGWQIERCFVEREHTNDDSIGANLVPEGLETGEYVWQNYARTNYSDTMCLCAITTIAEDYEKFYGIWGLNDEGNPFYSGLNIINFGYGATVGANLTAWLTNLALRPGGIDSVKSIVWLPKSFFSSTGDISASDIVFSEVLHAPDIQRGSTIQGYGTPRNKKLLTYPYYFLHVTNNQGECADYRYEYFDNPTSIGLQVYGSVASGIPEMMLYPLNYKGMPNNVDEHVSLNNFPQVPWVSNTFLDWLSSNWVNVGTGMMSGALSGAGQIQNNARYESNAMAIMANHFGSMNGLGDTFLDGSELKVVGSIAPQGQLGATQTGLQIANMVGNTFIKSSLPNTAHGHSSPSLLREVKRNDYFIGKMTIKPEFAEIIDGYFDRFGYATHKTKLPNLRGRAQWNYVKTVDCSVEPLKMSLEYAPIIEQMFDNGVTIWHNINNIGNYSLSNPIVNN